jgi:hypothetical protein
MCEDDENHDSGSQKIAHFRLIGGIIKVEKDRRTTVNQTQK